MFKLGKIFSQQKLNFDRKWCSNSERYQYIEFQQLEGLRWRCLRLQCTQQILLLLLYCDSSKRLLTFPWDRWTSEEHQSRPWQFTLCQISHHERERERSAASTTTWKNATSRLRNQKEKDSSSASWNKCLSVIQSYFWTTAVSLSTSLYTVCFIFLSNYKT